MKLLSDQKNDLFDIIEIYGLSPSQFELSEIDSKIQNDEIATILKFQNTDFYFLFDIIGHKKAHRLLSCSPSEKLFSEEWNVDILAWEEHLILFHVWLKALKKEITTIDKWERFRTAINQIDLKYDTDEGKFNVSEFELLKSKIDVLKAEIKNIGLLEEQIETFNDKLDFLVEEAKRMSKFDWKSLFIGSILQLILRFGLSDENAKFIWDSIKLVFNQYFLN